MKNDILDLNLDLDEIDRFIEKVDIVYVSNNLHFININKIRKIGNYILVRK